MVQEIALIVEQESYKKDLSRKKSAMKGIIALYLCVYAVLCNLWISDRRHRHRRHGHRHHS